MAGEYAGRPSPQLKLDPIDNLDQDISATYVEAEVQAVSDKVDEILEGLRAKGLLKS